MVYIDRVKVMKEYQRIKCRDQQIAMQFVEDVCSGDPEAMTEASEIIRQFMRYATVIKRTFIVDESVVEVALKAKGIEPVKVKGKIYFPVRLRCINSAVYHAAKEQ